jgi:opacity protein-like surface antigen
MTRKTAAVLLIVLSLAILAASVACAQEAPVRSKWIREVGFDIGYGLGPVQHSQYEFVTILPHVGIDLGEALALAGARPAGVFELIVEPLGNVVRRPRLDFEEGLDLLFKYGGRLGRFMPFIEAGAGVVWMNNLVPEQSDGASFLPQVGAGFHFFLTPNWALTASYRFRHLSNCGLTRPNHGVNSDLALLGATFIFAR